MALTGFIFHKPITNLQPNNGNPSDILLAPPSGDLLRGMLLSQPALIRSIHFTQVEPKGVRVIPSRLNRQ